MPAYTITETSGQTYGFGDKTYEARYRRLAEESLKRFIGLMPTKAFLQTFLRSGEISKEDMPSSKEAFRRKSNPYMNRWYVVFPLFFKIK